MRRPSLPVAVLATIMLATATAGCDVGPAPAASPVDDGAATSPPEVAGRVTAVIDGDTIRLRTDAGRSERVRLLGIDAPELSTTRTGSAQCGGAQAQALLEDLAPPGTAVWLREDPTQDARDRFGRLLGYLALRGHDQPLQELLLRAGWARVYVYGRDPFALVGRFRGIASRARAARRGVWDECGGRFDRPVSQ